MRKTVQLGDYITGYEKSLLSRTLKKTINQAFFVSQMTVWQRGARGEIRHFPKFECRFRLFQNNGGFYQTLHSGVNW